jgi:eukaryotic-like serine/threonine-protein kinase
MAPERPLAGQMLGPYRLLQPIGAGGMGEVWLAEQKQPVRRRVAIKLIKAGMDTREVVARFESERQAVALMEHPKFSTPVRLRRDALTS